MGSLVVNYRLIDLFPLTLSPPTVSLPERGPRSFIPSPGGVLLLEACFLVFLLMLSQFILWVRHLLGFERSPRPGHTFDSTRGCPGEGPSFVPCPEVTPTESRCLCVYCGKQWGPFDPPRYPCERCGLNPLCSFCRPPFYHKCPSVSRVRSSSQRESSSSQSPPLFSPSRASSGSPENVLPSTIFDTFADRGGSHEFEDITEAQVAAVTTHARRKLRIAAR